MTEEKNNCANSTATERTQTKVELQILPCVKNTAQAKATEVLNHESQDDCVGKIILTVTCDGAKLTKADAGRIAGTDSLQHDVWASVKSTKCDAGKMPDIDVNIHEQYSLKMTKADSGKV